MPSSPGLLDGGVKFLREALDQLIFPSCGEEFFGLEVALHVGEGIALGAEQGLTNRAIGLALDQHWTATIAHSLETFVGYPVDGHHIVAVDSDTGQAISL